ncbi:MAG: hypothetical protein J6P43_06135 [Succinivibrionaceae bacterium]|nr:hypothetical protein [Succinivibrionaceae bacterium]
MSDNRFFEELAQILTEQARKQGRETVSEQFVTEIVQPAAEEFSDDEDLRDAVEQEAIDPISLFNLFANTTDTASGSADDKTEYLLERTRDVFHVKSEIPDDIEEILAIDADLTEVDNNQIWDVFSALNNMNSSNAQQQAVASDSLGPLIEVLLGGAQRSNAQGGGGLNLGTLLQFAFMLWPELRNTRLGALGTLLGTILGGGTQTGSRTRGGGYGRQQGGYGRQQGGYGRQQGGYGGSRGDEDFQRESDGAGLTDLLGSIFGGGSSAGSRTRDRGYDRQEEYGRASSRDEDFRSEQDGSGPADLLGTILGDGAQTGSRTRGDYGRQEEYGRARRNEQPQSGGSAPGLGDLIGAILGGGTSSGSRQAGRGYGQQSGNSRPHPQQQNRSRDDGEGMDDLISAGLDLLGKMMKK